MSSDTQAVQLVEPLTKSERFTDYVNSTIVQSGAIILATTLVIISILLKDKLAALWKKKRLTPKRLKADLDRDNHIMSIMGQMLEKYQCDRAYVFLLHNGGSFGNGIDMKKMSCVYEDTHTVIKTKKPDCQTMLLIGMPAAVSAIVDSYSEPLIISVKDMEASQFKLLLTLHGVKIAAIKALTQGNRIIGFIGFEYCWEYDKPIEVESLSGYAIQVEALLHNTL